MAAKKPVITTKGLIDILFSPMSKAGVFNLPGVVAVHPVTSAVSEGSNIASEPVVSERRVVIDGRTFLVQVHRITAGSELA